MLSKYPGTCAVCKKPTRANVDVYDLESKRNFHEACQHPVDLFSDVEAEETAARCGFVGWNNIESVQWSELRYEVNKQKVNL